MDKGKFSPIYTEDELGLIHDFFVHGEPISALEKVIGRNGATIITKLYVLKQKEPGRWEAAYHFYLKSHNEEYGEEIRRGNRERHKKRKMENIAMAEQMAVHEGDVKKFIIVIR